VTEGDRSSIRFSCFGEFVTILNVELVKNEWLIVIKALFEQYGYVYIPKEVLDQPYTGMNHRKPRFATWFSRYFYV
jgi:hypothetical protein